MLKVTPDPPDSNHLCAHINTTARKPSRTFVIAPGLDTETLLAHACESLASANVMASDFAALLEGSQRSTMLGIAQVIMLGELAVNQALDNLDPQE
ncbi:hypothetical protein EI969_04935 [Pseudomonas sp. PB101]|jgi:hypothetical protein|uniref:DUF6124 family protein n=1 Tax=Pseudomonas sp. PB101 TaxID=2495428 RepID=UPI001366314B|nr:DUF6124 family protein [Pseudomonas sp. PB101]MVW85298.1 hypothetical protein [Pseudomonas sp. PB101]